MKRTQVVGIGNALVDVIAHTDDAFLNGNGVEKGIMQLIDRPRAIELYGHMGPAREVSGGSAANTIAGLAALGTRTTYVGKVKDDQLGSIFAHDLRAQGAGYATPLAPKDHPHETGRCMVLVTGDGERSMNTYLGVSEFLSPDDIDEAEMAETEWVFLEGYRYDGPDSIAAFEKAVRATKRAGGRVGITLSDPFCVERHRDEFLRMIRADVDLLLANEHELKSLYLTDDLDGAMAAGARRNPDHRLHGRGRRRARADRGRAVPCARRSADDGGRRDRRGRSLRGGVLPRDARRGATGRPARGWATSRRARSSAISARDRRRTSGRCSRRRGCPDASPTRPRSRRTRSGTTRGSGSR